ncbi:MAG: sensor histidine kinase, partial [Acidobacteria bacterium]|nr:sensor histidine kinase [Bryobacteraceae bacterium CoA2 C42]
DAVQRPRPPGAPAPRPPQPPRLPLGGPTPPRPHLLVHVRDRGPGIPPADLEHLFEPFYRGERAKADHLRGTGLGLSLVAEIARAHGGAITAQNLPAGGAEFTLRLPAALPEQYDEFAHPAR